MSNQIDRPEQIHTENTLPETPENDAVMGGNVIDMEYMKSPQQKQFIRRLLDTIDEDKAKFPDQLEFVKYDKSTNKHRVIYNPFSPNLEGTTLVSTQSFLFDPAPIAHIVCFDANLNSNIAMLSDNKNKVPWNVTTQAGETMIGIRTEEPTSIEGLSITLGEKREYSVVITCINSDNLKVTETFDIALSPLLVGVRQFLLFKNKIDGINRIKIVIKELTTDATFTYNLTNVSIFKAINRDLLQAMSDFGILSLTEINNPVFIKEDKTEFPEEETPKQ